MQKPSLRYEDSNMWSKAVGKNGASPAEWAKMLPRLRMAKKALQKIARTGDQGFLQLPFDRSGVEQAKKLAQKMSKRFTDLIVLGIGGSDLAARALQQALAAADVKKRGLRVHFAGASTDPTDLTQLLARLDLKKTCINIISKSGDTLEPMSAFLVLRDRLIKAVGLKRMPQHIVATTDAEGGSLRALAKREGYATLAVPANVGGRFSVLSAVGLFPAAAMGIDLNELLAGARTVVEAFHEYSPNECPATRFAGLHVLAAEKRKQRILVTAAYSSQLAEFGRWTRQLIAESLGKKKNRSGKVVHAGLTPVSCIGPEDQHSQLQLWSEGPADKLMTFIETDEFAHTLRTPIVHGLGNVIDRFGDRSFADLIHLERKATAESLRLDKRPNGTLFIERLDARGIGELILFFEITVALMGELFQVDAYNQPGVEQSKQLMRAGLDV